MSLQIMQEGLKRAMITEHIFGQLPDGTDVIAYDMSSETGLSTVILSYGATLQSLRLPCGLDVVLGFDNLEGYLGNHPYFGAAIGRVANRIGGAKIKVEGVSYPLSANEGRHTLHGGAQGFNRANWTGDIHDDVLTLKHISPDGDQGFPGRVESEFEFTLQGSTLSITMRAKSDKTTPINLTHHSYFNLTNGGQNICDDHRLEVLADEFTPMDNGLPTGAFKSVDDTAFDFRVARPLSRLNPLDHNFIRRGFSNRSDIKKVAKLWSTATGNKVIICSNQPCLQVYTGEFMPHITGKKGVEYAPFHGVTIEPQGFVDSLNHADFPDEILEQGSMYTQTIRYTFRTERII